MFKRKTEDEDFDGEDGGTLDAVKDFLRENGLIVVGVLGAFCFAALVIYLLRSEGANYTPSEPEVLPAIKRDLFAAAPKVDVKKIFNDKRIEGLEGGQGVVQPLIKTYRNRVIVEDKFTILPAQTGDEVRTHARQSYVAKRVEEFEEALKQFSSNSEPLLIEGRVFFDDSSGVSSLELKLLEQMQTAFGWRRRISNGDGAQLEFRKLSAVESTDKFVVAIEKGKKDLTELDKGLRWMTSSPQEKPNSSIATSIAHALKQEGPKEVSFISDFMENSPLGDFYKNPPEKDTCEQIAGQLFANEPLPDDLEGFTIDMFVVLRGDRTKVHKARQCYEQLFTARGAKVFSHF